MPLPNRLWPEGQEYLLSKRREQQLLPGRIRRGHLYQLESFDSIAAEIRSAMIRLASPD